MSAFVVPLLRLPAFWGAVLAASALAIGLRRSALTSAAWLGATAAVLMLTGLALLVLAHLLAKRAIIEMDRERLGVRAALGRIGRASGMRFASVQLLLAGTGAMVAALLALVAPGQWLLTPLLVVVLTPALFALYGLVPARSPNAALERVVPARALLEQPGEPRHLRALLVGWRHRYRVEAAIRVAGHGATRRNPAALAVVAALDSDRAPRPALPRSRTSAADEARLRWPGLQLLLMAACPFAVLALLLDAALPADLLPVLPPFARADLQPPAADPPSPDTGAPPRDDSSQGGGAGGGSDGGGSGQDGGGEDGGGGEGDGGQPDGQDPAGQGGSEGAGAGSEGAPQEAQADADGQTPGAEGQNGSQPASGEGDGGTEGDGGGAAAPRQADDGGSEGPDAGGAASGSGAAPEPADAPMDPGSDGQTGAEGPPAAPGNEAGDGDGGNGQDAGAADAQPADAGAQAGGDAADGTDQAGQPDAAGAEPPAEAGTAGPDAGKPAEGDGAQADAPPGSGSGSDPADGAAEAGASPAATDLAPGQTDAADGAADPVDGRIESREALSGEAAGDDERDLVAPGRGDQAGDETLSLAPAPPDPEAPAQKAELAKGGLSALMAEPGEAPETIGLRVEEAGELPSELVPAPPPRQRVPAWIDRIRPR